MTDMETVKARYPDAEITSIQISSGNHYLVIENRAPLSMGWWSTEERAWASARAILEEKAPETNPPTSRGENV